MKPDHFRRAAVAAAALVLLLSLTPVASPAAGADLTKIGCSIPKIQLERTLRGFRADHSGDIQLFTKEPDYVGSGLPHIAPFDYVQEVPLVLYGPGYIKAQGPIKRPTFNTDIPATMAELLDFKEFTAPDGKSLSDALEPAAQRSEPPRLIVLMVWDAGGKVVLNQWPHDWPYLKSLMDKEGTSYSKSTIGSSPASTAQIHAEMGTGAFPAHHGVVGHHYRIGEVHVSPWKDPATEPILPTLADLYDRDMGNKPKIGLSGTVAIHMGMESHGALWGGGDKDIAVLREADAALNPRGTLGMEGIEWKLSPALQGYFTIPSYVNDLQSIADFFPETDVLDGKRDNKWRGEPLDVFDKVTLGGFETPARVGYQQRMFTEVMKREGFGQDAVPDLMFINEKLIDSRIHIGHGLNGPETGDAVKIQDLYLKKFVGFLNNQVGVGKWAMIMTADHGATPYPKVSNAFVISPGKIAQVIKDQFGDDTVQFVQPTQIFLNKEALTSSGHSVEDVAKFVMTIKRSQVNQFGPPTAANENPPDSPPFEAAIPADLLPNLPCVKDFHF